MTVKGVLWHSTGCNNPWLKRYVQPDDNASDREAWLKKLGVNRYKKRLEPYLSRGWIELLGW
jgi:hypothetical protein